MNRKNSLQKIGMCALSGAMALSFLAPAVHADGEGDRAFNFPVFRVIGPGALLVYSPIQPWPQSMLSVTYQIQMPPSSVIQSLKPLNEHYSETRIWTEADEFKYQKHYMDGVNKFIKEVFQHRELLIQDPRYSSSIDRRAISIQPRKTGVYKLWGEPGRRIQIENENKAFVPHIKGLVLSPSVKAKLDTFATDGLSYLPIDMRLSIIRDFENVFTAVREEDRESVIDSFTNIALNAKSSIYEETVKDDYCQLAYDEFMVLRHPETLPSQLDFINETKLILSTFYNLYLATFTGLLNGKIYDIRQRYEKCGLPMSTILGRLSFKKNIGIFDEVYAIRPSATKTAVSVEAFEKIIKDYTEDLDPMLRDKIRTDFHGIITTASVEHGELDMFNKTFAFCQAIFAFKGRLYDYLKPPDPLLS